MLTPLTWDNRIHKAVEEILEHEGIPHKTIGEAFKMLREDASHSKVTSATSANDILSMYEEIILYAKAYVPLFPLFLPSIFLPPSPSHNIHTETLRHSLTLFLMSPVMSSQFLNSNRRAPQLPITCLLQWIDPTVTASKSHYLFICQFKM